jgi:hypothetical protein
MMLVSVPLFAPFLFLPQPTEHMLLGPNPRRLTLLGWLVYVLILNSLEINIAILICCLPALKTLFRRARQKSRGHKPDQPYNTPEIGKTRDPLEDTTSRSDNNSSSPVGPHRGPSLDIAGAIGYDRMNWNESPHKMRQDLEKMTSSQE